MQFVKVSGGAVVKFPYTLRDARADYPMVSFPKDISVIPEDTLNVHGIYSVTQQPDPSFNPSTHKLVQGTPVNSGGSWVVTREVVPLSASELEDVDYKADLSTLKNDFQVLALLKSRPNVIDNYIDNNVTDLASAKNVLKILARAVAVVANLTLR